MLHSPAADDLPQWIIESDAAGGPATTAFVYDDRDRLIREVRVAADPAGEYDLSYTYDAGGNRLAKIDAMNEVEVSYVYDISDPATYRSNNNRLMFYSTISVAGEMSTPVSTTWYYYNESGNAESIVTEQAANPGVYGAYRLGYAHNGEAVSFVLGESWSEDGPDAGACADNYSVSFAREFRYDTGRARYLNRELDPVALMQSPPQFVPFSETWSDYDGDEVYGDYTVTPGSPTTIDHLRSFLLGVGLTDPWTSAGGTNTQYYHADLVGTTRVLTDSVPTLAGQAVYSAFGQQIDGTAHRYGYAGAWGYQSQDEFPFLHVGARYYDPATGRFLQRDPIGIVGALNVYEYVGGSPTAKVDPTGLVEMWNWNRIEHYQPGRKPSTSQSVEDMQRELRREKTISLICIGGLAGILRALPGGNLVYTIYTGIIGGGVGGAASAVGAL